jgi:hypothetical protein
MPASQLASNRCYGPTINPFELLKSMENTNPKNKTKQHKVIISRQTKQNNTRSSAVGTQNKTTPDHQQ